MGKHSSRQKQTGGRALEELIDPKVARELKKEQLKKQDMDRMWRQHGHFSRTFGGDSDRRFGRK